MIKKDSLPIGILVGAVSPFIFLPVFYGIIYLVVMVFGAQAFMTLNSLILLSIAPNFILVRYFFNRRKQEHTGQGVIFITVGYVLMFFIFIHGTRLLHLPGLQW